MKEASVGESMALSVNKNNSYFVAVLESYPFFFTVSPHFATVGRKDRPLGNLF